MSLIQCYRTVGGAYISVQGQRLYNIENNPLSFTANDTTGEIVVNYRGENILVIDVDSDQVELGGVAIFGAASGIKNLLVGFFSINSKFISEGVITLLGSEGNFFQSTGRNDLGIVDGELEYVVDGQFRINKTGAFKVNKTVVKLNSFNFLNDKGWAGWERNDLTEDFISILSMSLDFNSNSFIYANGIISNMPITIEVSL